MRDDLIAFDRSSTRQSNFAHPMLFYSTKHERTANTFSRQGETETETEFRNCLNSQLSGHFRLREIHHFFIAIWVIICFAHTQ